MGLFINKNEHSDIYKNDEKILNLFKCLFGIIPK